jgi:hypothetical protein
LKPAIPDTVDRGRRRDISSCVHVGILRLAAGAAFFLVLTVALHPLRETTIGELWPCAMSLAFNCSWLAVVVGAWSAIRVRTLRVVVAMFISIVIFATTVGYLYSIWFTF